jgi:hypothetical protein
MGSVMVVKYVQLVVVLVVELVVISLDLVGRE